MTRATKIQHEGFLTKPGRIGDGAYFWTAMNDDQLSLSTYLAASWARRCHLDWNSFANDLDPTPAVIQVTVEVDEEEMMYLDDPEHHLDLRQELIEFAVRHFHLDSVFDLTKEQFSRIKRRLYALIEAYIQFYEEELGRKVRVVFKSQIPPKDGRDRISEILGNASCFSIRDTSCITDMQVEHA